MRTTTHRLVKYAIVMSAKEYEAILEYLKLQGYDVYVWAMCVDGKSLQFDTPEELLEYPNSNSSRIQHLCFRSNYPSFEESIELNFSDGLYQPCEIKVSSNDEDRSNNVVHALERRCSQMKPYYSFFGMARWSVVLASLIFGYGLAILIIISKANKTDDLDLWSMLAPVLFIVFFLIFNFLQGFLFPQFILLVGKEIERHTVLAHWRKWALGFIFSPILLSLGAAIWRLITQ